MARAKAGLKHVCWKVFLKNIEDDNESESIRTFIWRERWGWGIVQDLEILVKPWAFTLKEMGSHRGSFSKEEISSPTPEMFVELNGPNIIHLLKYPLKNRN